MPSWCLNVRQVKILEEAAEEAIEAAACSENELTIIRLSGNSQNSNLIKISFLLVNNLIIVFSSKCNIPAVSQSRIDINESYEECEFSHSDS